jgi:hypothetical protein
VTGFDELTKLIAVPLVPVMTPELTMAAAAVKFTLLEMLMPVLAVIVPELLILPANVETPAT